MAKRTFTSIEWLHLTELAHAATLAGMLSARRWGPGELKFQGGTSLHLVYGSPRFSEDLDFVTATTKGLKASMTGAIAHVKAAFMREFPSLSVSLKVRDEEFIADPRNPRLFTITLAEPDWHQSLKVKVEFFIVAEQAQEAYESTVRPMMSLRPKLRVDIPQVHLETAQISEILCDKLHALGDRARLKERDVFDLWWICNQEGLSPRQAAELFGARHEAHLAMYPGGRALPELAGELRSRADALLALIGPEGDMGPTTQAIARWLPTSDGTATGGSSLLASEQSTRVMVEHAANCALATAEVIEQIVEVGGQQAPDHAGARERAR